MKELKLNPKYYVSNEERQKICNDYLFTDLSVSRLSKKYNRSVDTISRILHGNSISIVQKPHYKKILNVFDKNNYLVLENVTIQEVMKYIKDNKINNNPYYTTIVSNINRESKLLYGCLRLELIREEKM